MATGDENEKRTKFSDIDDMTICEKGIAGNKTEVKNETNENQQVKITEIAENFTEGVSLKNNNKFQLPNKDQLEISELGENNSSLAGKKDLKEQRNKGTINSKIDTDMILLQPSRVIGNELNGNYNENSVVTDENIENCRISKTDIHFTHFKVALNGNITNYAGKKPFKEDHEKSLISEIVTNIKLLESSNENDNELNINDNEEIIFLNENYFDTCKKDFDITVAESSELSGYKSSLNDSGVTPIGEFSSYDENVPSKHEREKRVKLGHRRIRPDGQVTYKNILTSYIVNSIQLGIEHAISQLTSKRDLLMQDFMTAESIPFSSSGSKETPAHNYSQFVFTTYAPTAFRYFRELFGIKPETFVTSFCRKPLKELANSGKSGSIFYLTGDDQFIIKTMQSKECSFLQSLLPGYYLNLHQNPNTLLPKYFGLYCYRCDRKKIKLVVMNNILPSSIKISQTYDLKGATYKCRATKGNGNADSFIIYKDLDFLNHHPSGLYLENETYNALMKTIKRDCTVLESFKIMDYSLLLGISKIENWVLPPNEQVTTSNRISYENNSSSVDANTQSDNNWTDLNTFPFSLTNNSKCPGSNNSKSFFNLTPKSQDELNFRLTDIYPHGGIPALNGEGEPILIFVGIIDILQSYKFKKKMEHALKSIIHDGDTISVHKPGFYSARFQRFMSEKVFKKISFTNKRKPIKCLIGKQHHINHPPKSFS